ncbi:hypothetical protein H5S09_02745 [Limosilactobacillus sp. STM2_1]|uniref:Uncharacterized protein n=1 Tax=Limosilactobacillus rudii TaxID=2759755 RepID=A0A7W3UJQ0_9LACO|nr:hypothetical protein [Limosilactobacillus rudii]MBB1080228.1 hypothetical protein [Limosilactobacillus rudii]MBB1096868.1 hypothetical protein [Limosilactobacillus rudii]MCD7133766.1 hypothetical protein [Limosilactobacillus rudii]
MIDKVKTAWGAFVALIVVILCGSIVGLILGGLISANLLLWHWIISVL